LWEVLGPGLVKGLDDDPSGIATYSQVGAQFGYGLAWRCCFPIRCWRASSWPARASAR
jgi:Mn2+/Fe2+ NRAMP family transporter